MSHDSSQPSVVFVTRKWPPAVGGMETFSVNVSNALSDHADLTRIALPGRRDGAPPGMAAILGFGLRTALKLAVHHRGRDVLHISDMASWPLALAYVVGNRRGRVALSANGTDVSFPRRGTVLGRLYGRYLRIGARLLPRAIVIANSQATEAEIRRYGYKRTHVVPLATDFRRQTTTVDTSSLLFSGRITPLKGLRWFVENVLDALPEDLRLDVVGTIWDREEAACLEHTRVRHLGHLDQATLARHFASALAVVVPNVPVPSGQFEGFGLVAPEAAAAGGVVLASDHGGLKEAVIDGETGITLPAADAAAWIDAILRVRSWSDAERQSFTDTASRKAREFYAWNRVARQMLAAYESAGSDPA